MRTIKELFDDQALVEKIKVKLPKLFQIAELESSRDGKIGMEVGTMREKILTALLIYTFGEENVNSKIPTTEAEVDVKLFDEPVSVKTKTSKSKNPGGFKLIWTVDEDKAAEFGKTYEPSCGMILVHMLGTAI
ncbi:hypothetical protein FACS189427_01380 [Planctomycetales bacterium]|nr:hypothetical protein FACS189427_01380 [Planctomycetales bacterium]